MVRPIKKKLSNALMGVVMSKRPFQIPDFLIYEPKYN